MLLGKTRVNSALFKGMLKEDDPKPKLPCKERRRGQKHRPTTLSGTTTTTRRVFCGGGGVRRRRRRRRLKEEDNLICLSSLDSFIIIMLQKAKTIKKTIKTEVKAIVHGQERVDKRGKPVTSIADRTNVSALSSFFHFNRFSKMVGCWGKLSASNALFFFVKMLLPREDTQQFFIKKTTTT